MLKSFNHSYNLKTVNVRNQLYIVLAVFLSLFSCSEEPTNGDRSDVNPVYTADDYFRAVYFVDGPLTTALGEYGKLSVTRFSDEQSIAEARKQQAKVLGYIREKHPHFLATFRQNVASGDYHIVQAAVKEGVRVYKEATETLPPGTISFNTADIVNDNPAADVVLFLILYPAVILYPGSSEAILARKGSYSFEDYVATITTGLAGT
jgi:SdpC family antimicrobial peptide